MSRTRIAYSQHPDVTPEAEVSALAAIYELCIDSHARKEAAPASRPDDAERSLNDGANTNCTG
jgi:hypothetical protein